MDAERLRRIPLFEGLPKHDLERVAAWADEVDVPEGRHLLEQGRFSYEFLIIAEGEVEIRQDRRPIAALGPGDFVGEIGMLEHDRRTATVVTITPVRAIVMAEREFESMLDGMPAVAARLRETEQRRLTGD